MNMLANINQLMSKGYKMTDYSCTHCSSVTFSKPNSNLVNCPKCVKQYAPQFNKNQEQADVIEDQYEEFLKEYQNKAPKHNKSDDVSKKIGNKLIQGWTMLEQACHQCNVPLMKNKNGEKICCACDRNFKQQEKKSQKTKIEKQQTLEKVQQNKKQQIPQQQNKPQRISPTKTQQKKQNNKTEQRCDQKTHLVNQMCIKSLTFLNQRLDEAIKWNRLDDVSKIIDLLGKIKNI